MPGFTVIILALAPAGVADTSPGETQRALVTRADAQAVWQVRHDMIRHGQADGAHIPEFRGYAIRMPPVKTEKTQPVTLSDGDRLAVLEGLVHHLLQETHDQNRILAKLETLCDEAAPLLESKLMTRLRAKAAGVIPRG
jgi:hypothetical protein